MLLLGAVLELAGLDLDYAMDLRREVSALAMRGEPVPTRAALERAFAASPGDDHEVVNTQTQARHKP